MLVIPMRLQTPWIPVAAEVHVAIFLHVGELKGAQGVDVVMKGRIGVPGSEKASMVRVQEREGGGKGVVVVDYVAKVSH